MLWRNRVCVAPGEDEFGEAQLANAAQTLQLGCVQKPPNELIETVLLMEYDEVVDRLADTLSLRSLGGDSPGA
jgi:hypothetical protein